MHCFYCESELKGKKDFLNFEQKMQIFFFAFSVIWGDLFLVGSGVQFSLHPPLLTKCTSQSFSLIFSSQNHPNQTNP